jgi:penicillin amidase
MQEIQGDVTSLFGVAHRQAAARSLEAAGYPSLADSVAAWDGTGRLESVAPTLFHAWYEALRDALRSRAYGPGTAGGYLSHAAVLDALAQGLPEDLQRRTGEAAAAAAVPWGEVHQLYLSHPLAQVAALEVIFGFDRGGIPRAGTPHTVDVADYGSGDGFPVRNGASQRHVSDLADLDAGGFVLPGGQSGYPGGRHALDQLPLWLEGKLVPVPLSRAGAEARTVRRTALQPAGDP